MGNLNLDAEERALDAREGVPPAPEPGFVHKATTFLSLFVTTMHPAVWDHRRIALSRREGRIRAEAHIRESEIDGPSENEDPGQREQRERRIRAREELIADHQRRPQWIRNYLERARSGDWVDDAD
jgi:hypothetical protein